MPKFDTFWKIANCEICGKEFIPTYKYVYKIRDRRNRLKYYCSYTCWRKAGGDGGKDIHGVVFKRRASKKKMS